VLPAARAGAENFPALETPPGRPDAPRALKYQSTVLPGGLRVVTARMPAAASVSVGIWIGTGGRHESARLNGAAHFIEHMLFKGTRRRTAARISQDVEGIGGYLNAFTDEEHTCFYSRARADRMPELVDVLLDMFLESTFAPGDLRRERDVILEEQAMYLDQPSEHVHDLLNAAQFPGHALGRPVIGTDGSVKGLRRADLVGFMHDHYVAGATVIAAAGAVDHAALVRLVARRACDFRAGPRRSPDPCPSAVGGPTVRLHSKATEQTHLALGVRTVSRHDPRRFPLRLLNVILGENMSSRLSQVVREDRGLAYTIHSSATAWEDCGDLVISAGVDDSKLEEALGLIVRELHRMTLRPPAREELARARDYVLGQFDLNLEGTEQKMMWLGEQWIGYGRLTPPARLKQRLTDVTAAEVGAVAREFLKPSGYTLALVSPRRSDRGLERILSAGVASAVRVRRPVSRAGGPARVSRRAARGTGG
jgi:predicted Zn-dependent peptidase